MQGVYLTHPANAGDCYFQLFRHRFESGNGESSVYPNPAQRECEGRLSDVGSALL
jgi:hypothetical protein